MYGPVAQQNPSTRHRGTGRPAGQPETARNITSSVGPQNSPHIFRGSQFDAIDLRAPQPEKIHSFELVRAPANEQRLSDVTKHAGGGESKCAQ